MARTRHGLADKARFSTAIAIVAAAMVAIASLVWGTSARADVAGPACVEDGDTLVINGRRSYGACQGGEVVDLYGIDAPELEQTCTARGQSWQCGRQAAATLLRLTLKKTVTCLGNSYDRDNHLVGECSAGGVNLNSMMVRQGLAVTDGPRYAREEGQARAEGAGMWMGSFERPADWRAAHD